LFSEFAEDHSRWLTHPWSGRRVTDAALRRSRHPVTTEVPGRVEAAQIQESAAA
jgi:hypothetical protein